MRTLLCVLVACSFTPSAMAAMVTYQFHATSTSNFGIIGMGDTMSGVFGYDNGDTTGAGGITLALQNAPHALLSFTYTQRSTGQTATGGINPNANSIADLEILSAAPETTFHFGDTFTNPNTISGGISVSDLMFRFGPAVPSVPADLSGLTLTFLTMSVSGYGPNFVLDSVTPVPLPLPVGLLASGLLAFVGIGSRARRVAA